MKEIILTQGKVAIVDDEDFEKINKYKWHARKHGNTYYASRTSRDNGKKNYIEMPWLIIGHPGKGCVSDHIDGNGLDNQKKNLRNITIRDNQCNRHHEKSSKFPGVYWEKTRGMWRSNIKIAGKIKSLGYFRSEELAFEKYRAIRQEIGCPLQV